MKVITISGKAQNGKDTTAGLLKAALEADGYKVLITHYADLLKYICKQFFGWDGQKDDAGRHILQYVGTDIIRQKRPNYWVGFVTSILELFPNEWDYVLIPDCRFPNEIDYLKEAGLDTVNLRVVRKNFKSPLTPEQQVHPEWIQRLATYGNVVVKFGRYIPNQKHIFDEVLGVELASDNQYAERFGS